MGIFMKKLVLFLAILAFPVSVLANSPIETTEEREVRIAHEKLVHETNLAVEKLAKDRNYADNFIGSTIESIKPGTLPYIRSLDRVLRESMKKLKIDNQDWIEYKIEFSQFTIWYRFQNKEPANSLISRIDVKGNRFKLPSGVKIGSSKESIMKLFGAHREGTDNYTKYCGIEPENCVTFYFNKQRSVKHITITSN